MEENIEHIIEIEFENKQDSKNIDLVNPLRHYIENGKNDTKRNMAAAILNNISRYHLLKDTFDFLVRQAKKEKSKHLKSEFIRHLQGLQSNKNSVDFLIDLTKRRETIPKRNAYRALITIKHTSIEDHVLARIQLEKDNGVIESAIRSLAINGTQKSILPLIQIFKKSRDGSIRGNIVQVLEQIVNREKLTNDQLQVVTKFSKQSKIGFEYIWKGKPTIISKTEILQEARKQLLKNRLNLEFCIDEDFKASINVDKMRKDYLRFLNFSISSNEKPVFFKDLKIFPFGTGTGYNYTEILDKNDQMKPKEYASEILDIIRNQAIPYIFDIHLGAKKVLLWNFNEIKNNYQELLENLKIEHDHLELEYFVQFSTLKKDKVDYKEFVEHCLNLWEDVKHFRDYRTREYLLNELNTVGNMR